MHAMTFIERLLTWKKREHKEIRTNVIFVCRALLQMLPLPGEIYIFVIA